LLFKAYFEDGKSLGDDAVLIEAAEQVGLDRKLWRAPAVRATPTAIPSAAEIDQARQMGVTGVPCFIIDMQYAVVGAQSAEALADAMRKIVQEKATPADRRNVQLIDFALPLTSDALKGRL
jgi:predicted DsbA family dithiol-disulfide isomerase